MAPFLVVGGVWQSIAPACSFRNGTKYGTALLPFVNSKFSSLKASALTQ